MEQKKNDFENSKQVIYYTGFFKKTSYETFIFFSKRKKYFYLTSILVTSKTESESICALVETDVVKLTIELGVLPPDLGHGVAVL